MTFVALLALAMGAGLFVQFALGALAPFIREDFAVSRTRFGALSTTVYLAGGLLSPFVGRLVDRAGGRRALVVLFACAALGWVAIAAAPSFAWLLAAVAVTGLPVALANPATNLLVSQHIQPARHGIVMGVKQAGAHASAVVAGIAIPAGAAVIGWRSVMLVSATACVIGMLATLRRVPSTRWVSRRRASRSERTAPLVWWLSAYAFFMGIGLSACFAYLPLYAFETLGLSTTQAGATTSVMGTVGAVAVVAWSWGAGRIERETGPLVVVAAVSALAAACLWVANGGPSGFVWAAAALLGAGGLSWFAIGFLAIVRGVEQAATGRATGAVVLAIFAGFIATPAAFGGLVDEAGYSPGWIGVGGAFGVAAGIALAWHALGKRSARRASAASEDVMGGNAI